VPVTIKEKILTNMKEKIKFSAGAEDVVKSAMLINMGMLFRKWKSEMNPNYVKKSLVPNIWVKLQRLSGKNLFNRRPILNPLPSVINLLRCRRRTSIPIAWDQKDMLVKIPNGRRK
jgi:hypothetical protein